MPNKIVKEAIKQSSEKNKGIKINWKKFAGAAYNGTTNLFQPVMPSTVNTLNSITSLSKDLRDATRASSSAVNRQRSDSKNSTEAKRSAALFKSALEDIGNGSYNVNKISSDLYDDYASVSDAFQMPSGDDAANMSSEEIILAGNAGIAKSVIQSSNAQLRGMEAISKSLIQSNIKVSQANSAIIVNSLNYGFNLLNTSIMITNKKLDMISTDLKILNQFNNTNTIQFYSKSLDMLNGIGQIFDNLQKTMDPPQQKKRKFDTSFGFNPKEYFDYVKEGIQESLLGSSKDVFQRLTGKKSFNFSNRRGEKAGGLLGFLLPEVLSKPLNDLDKNVSRFFDQALKRLADTLDNNPLFASFGLGSVFGNKRSVRNSLNLGAYSKDALPWNGLAQKALVEVIPELLTSIDAGINGTEKRYYDYNRGKFYGKSKIEKRFEEEYYDRLNLSLKDSMDVLSKIAAESGRTKQDQDRLIAKIEALIDDQVIGSRDVNQVRRGMEKNLYEFGIDETSAKKFIQEFQDGIENGIDQINELFNEISSGQSIYRNISNGRNDYTKKIDSRHRKHQNNYRQYRSIENPSKLISDIQKELNLTGYDLSKDDELITEIIFLSYMESSKDDLVAAIAAAYEAKAAKDKLSDWGFMRKIQEKKRAFDSKATSFGKKLTPYTDRINNKLYDLGNGSSYYKLINREGFSDDFVDNILDIYNDATEEISSTGTSGKYNVGKKRKINIKRPTQKISAHQYTEPTFSDNYPQTIEQKIQTQNNTYNNSTITVIDKSPNRLQSVHQPSVDSKPVKKSSTGKASSFFSRFRKNNVSVDSASAKAGEIGIQNALVDFDKTMNMSSTELDKTQMILTDAINDANKEEPANDITGSIIQSNNMTKTALGTIIAHLQGFSSRLFGKDGFIKKAWNSETRKKMTEKVKKKLFTGEDAIFGKQYESAKKALKDIKLRTKYYLGKGYNYIYDNTMKYMYGYDQDGNEIDYRQNEKYQNNKFLSQTLNLRWRRQQARKKRIEDAKKHQEMENVVNGKVTDGISTKNDNLVSSVHQPTKEHSYSRQVISSPKVKGAELSNKDIAIPKLKSSINSAIDNVEKSAENLKTSINTVSEVVAGDPNETPESKKKKFKTDFLTSMKRHTPKVLAGAIGGMTLGALNNSFSILGSMFLPGGPMAGAIFGGSLALLSQTEAFKTFMFGKMDPQTQKREGGLLTKEMQAKFKKMAPALIGGAVIGGVSSIIKGALGFNPSLGVLGMQILPGGILGGAMLGAGIGIIKHSDTFKNLLFGKKDEDGKRSGTFISDSWNKAKEELAKASPVFKRAAKGLGIGALSGAVLSNMGYLPALMSAGGPIGMGAIGLGLGIASSTKKFDEWLFGSEMLDKDGKVIGRNKDGMLTRVTNLIRVKAIEPITDEFKKRLLDFVDWSKLAITYPFRKGMGPILDSLIGIKDSVVDFVKDKFEILGEGIMKMMQSTIKSIFNPVTKLIGFIGKSMMGAASAGGKLALAPLAVGAQALSVLTAGKRAKEYIRFYKNYYRKGNIASALGSYWDAKAEDGQKVGLFGKISDIIGAVTGTGPIADAARAGWNAQQLDDGKNHLRWRNVGEEARDTRQRMRDRKKDYKKWKAIDKLRNKTIDELGGREVTFNDYTVKQYRKEFSKLGIDEKYLQTSDDIMDLLYRKNKVKDRISNHLKGEPIINTETPEQAAAREKTGQFQDHVSGVLDNISKHFGIVAAEDNERKAVMSAEERWKKSYEKLNKRFKKRGIKGVNLDDPSLRDYDIDAMSDDMVNAFRWSEEYATQDLKGFMDRMGITKKSEYKENKKPGQNIQELDYGTNHLKWKKDVANKVSTIDAGLIIKDTPAQEAYKDKVVELVTEIKDIVSGKKDSPLSNNEQNAKILAVTEEYAATANEMVSELKDIKKASEENVEANKDQAKSQLEETTEKKGFFSKLFSWRKKKKRDDKESAEQAQATALGDEENEEDAEDKKEVINKEDSELTKLWKKVKNLGVLLGGTAFGKFAIGAAKFGGSLGIISLLGFTIAELINPGTAAKAGAQINAFNEKVENNELTLDSVIEDFKAKAGELGNLMLDKMGSVGDWIRDTAIPAISPILKDVRNFIFEKLPELALDTASFLAENAGTVVDAFTTVVTELGPPLMEAVGNALPDLLIAIGKGISAGFRAAVKSTGQKIGEAIGIIPDADVSYKSKEYAEKDFKKTGRRYKENENKTKKTRVSESKAFDALQSDDRKERASVIQDPYSGEYYIYKEHPSMKVVTITTSSAEAMLQDQSNAGKIWYRPDSETYFVEEPTYTAWSESTYSDNGRLKSTRFGKILDTGSTYLKTKMIAKASPSAARFIGGIKNTTGKVINFFKKDPKFAKKSASVGMKIGGWGMKALSLPFAIGGRLPIIRKIPLVGSSLRYMGSAINLGGDTLRAGGDLFKKSALKTMDNKESEILKAAKGVLDRIKPKLIKKIDSIKNNKMVAKIFSLAEKTFKITVKESLEKLCKYLTEQCESAFAKVTGKTILKVVEVITTKASGKIGKKIITFFASSTPAAIGFAAYGAISGALSAANLFRVPEDKVDTKMRIIAAIMEGLLNVSIVALLDIIFTVIELVFGVDPKYHLAVFLYKLFSAYNDKVIDDLEASQEQLASEANVYNALNDTNMDIAEYNTKTNPNGLLAAGIRKLGRIFKNKNSEFNSYDDTKAYTTVLRDAGYSSEKISSMTKEEVISAIKANANTSSLDADTKQLVLSNIDSKLGYGIGNMKNEKYNHVFSHIPLGYGSNERNKVASATQEMISNLRDKAYNYMLQKRQRILATINDKGEVRNVPDAQTSGMLKTIASEINNTESIFRIDAIRGIETLPMIAKSILTLYTETSKDTTNILNSILTTLQRTASGGAKAVKNTENYMLNVAKTLPESVKNVSSSVLEKFKSAMGYGDVEDDYYKQGNSKWANMPIGYFPSGNVATMKNAGCGPTALAAVAHKLSLGYGPSPTNPASVAAYAASNGYITDGGANAGLFTEGAAKMGMYSKPVSDSRELARNLEMGRPTILTGQSSSSSTPYTSAGHIVVADKMVGNKARVLDPITGRQKYYDINNISRNTNHAWSYSLGYGLWDNIKEFFTIKDPNAGKGGATVNPSTSTKTKTSRPTPRSSAKKAPTYTASAGQSRGTTLEHLDAGIIDTGAVEGYKTSPNGIDNNILFKNYTYFYQNDGYYRKHFATQINKLMNKSYKVATRNGGYAKINALQAILSTQYFPLTGGTYGSVKVTAHPDQKNGGSASYINGDTYGPKISSWSGTIDGSYSIDRVKQIFAAAIISENGKGGTQISTLSNAEKLIAYLNGMRVIFGLAKTLNYVYNHDIMLILNKIVASEIADAKAAADGSGTSESSGTALESMSTDELVNMYMSGKNFFGKLKYMGLVIQAKVNSILGSGNYNQELRTLLINELQSQLGDTEVAGGSGGGSTISGLSGNLSSIMASPKNIQEELLAKTVENIYMHESGGNYASINSNDNGFASIGPYQARQGNAKTLLNNIAAAQGLPSNLRDTFRRYAEITQKQGGLSTSETSELKQALGNSEYSEQIKKATDLSAMQLFSNGYYRDYLAGYYDKNLIKDYRSLPLIADIMNAGPGFIVGLSKGHRYKGTEFINRWNPTSKEAELEKVYKTLIEPGSRFGDSNIYIKRVGETYNNLKNYQFKTKLEDGKTMQSMFDPGTNPMGFGIGDTTWGQQMEMIGKAIETLFAQKIGDPSMFGIGGSAGTSTDNNMITLGNFGGNVSASGSYSGTENLQSLSGTDKGRVVAAAKSQVGYLEKRSGSDLRSFRANPGSGDYTKYGAEIGSNPNAWCAYFTSWLGKAAGVDPDIYYRNGRCTTIMNHYKGKGQFIYRGEGAPQEGDLVLYNSGWSKISNPRNASGSSHVGLVVGYDGGDNVYTIEGNTSTKDGFEGVESKTRKLSSNVIIGFARPAWTGESRTVQVPSNLKLGYGVGDANYTVIDDIVKAQQNKEMIYNKPSESMSVSQFRELGFGPGMKVDAGFNMQSTDGKLDQIFAVIAEWYNESKKKASSSETKNVNVVTNNVVNNKQTVPTSSSIADMSSRYKERMVSEHATLAYRYNIRNMM